MLILNSWFVYIPACTCESTCCLTRYLEWYHMVGRGCKEGDAMGVKKPFEVYDEGNMHAAQQIAEFHATALIQLPSPTLRRNSVGDLKFT